MVQQIRLMERCVFPSIRCFLCDCSVATAYWVQHDCVRFFW